MWPISWSGARGPPRRSPSRRRERSGLSRFLISGLPRSRSAWFAVATGALHEPISREGYRDFVWPAGTGVADSGAGLWLAEIMDDFAPRVLIVERNVDEVIESIRRYVGSRVDLDLGALA